MTTRIVMPRTGARDHRGAGHGHRLGRLDVSYPSIAAASHDDATCTFELREGQRVVGTASISRDQLVGPPLHGVYRIHAVAARTAGDAAGVIAHCIAHATANEGRTLWCHAAHAAVDVWRRHGFSVAGPPAVVRGGAVAVLMVRRLGSARDAAS